MLVVRLAGIALSLPSTASAGTQQDVWAQRFNAFHETLQPPLANQCAQVPIGERYKHKSVTFRGKSRQLGRVNEGRDSLGVVGRRRRSSNLP